MREHSRWLSVVLLAGLVGCGDRSPAPAPAPAEKPAPAPAVAESAAPVAAAAEVTAAPTEPATVPPAAPTRGGGRPTMVTERKSAGPGQEADQQPLAWSETLTIPRADFRNFMERIPEAQRREHASIEKRRELLDNLIKFEELAEVARLEGLDQAPQVKLAAKSEMIKLLLERRFGGQVEVEIPEELVVKRYEADSSRYHQPERLRANRISFAGEEEATQVLARLREELAKPGNTVRRVFREFVRQYSREQADAGPGGDLGFFDRQGNREGRPALESALVEAAFAMHNINQVSGLVKGVDGFHILLLTHRREKVEIPLEEARKELESVIKAQLLEEERQKFLDEQVKLDRWQVDAAALAEISVAVPAEVPDGKERLRHVTGEEPPASPHPDKPDREGSGGGAAGEGP